MAAVAVAVAVASSLSNNAVEGLKKVGTYVKREDASQYESQAFFVLGKFKEPRKR